MKPILMIQNIWDDPSGLVGELIEARHIPYTLVNAERETIPEPSPYGAVIIFGGAQNANEDEKYPYLTQEKACIRQAIAQGIPFLGLCLGGQLLAAALGAEVRRHTVTEIGFSEVQFTQEGQHDPLFARLPGMQCVYQWHEDTFALPRDGVLLATNEHTTNQAFRVGPNAYGLQYHIELTPQMLDTWLHYPPLQEEVIKTLGQDGYAQVERDSQLYYSRYRKHTEIVVENFLSLAHYEPIQHTATINE